MTNTNTAIGAELIAAAQAVVDRWDTPLWKDVPATAEYIGRLRAALASATPQADSQPAPVVGTIAHVGTGKTTLARAIASALRAAPVEQPDTAYAGMPDDRESFKAYLKECDEYAIVPDVAGAFNAAWQRASRGQAPAGAASVTDAMVLAALQVQYPAGYDTQLRHPANGPKTSARTEAEIDLARRMIAAALATHSAPVPTAPSVLEDAGMLDWLEARGTVAIERCKYLGSDDAVIEVTPYNDDSYEGDTLRDAIRAAMAAKKGGQHD